MALGALIRLSPQTRSVGDDDRGEGRETYLGGGGGGGSRGIACYVAFIHFTLLASARSSHIIGDLLTSTICGSVRVVNTILTLFLLFQMVKYSVSYSVFTPLVHTCGSRCTKTHIRRSRNSIEGVGDVDVYGVH